MKFTICRSSDQYLSQPTPTKTWCPHKLASWDEQVKNWVVNLANIKDLTSLCVKTEAIVITAGNTYPNIEIDDLSD